MVKYKESYLETLNNIGNDLSASAKSAYEATIDKTFDANERKKVSEFFASAFNEGGEKGVEYMQNIVANSDDPLGLIDALNKINWKEANFKDIEKQLKSFNIGTDALKQYYEY